MNSQGADRPSAMRLGQQLRLLRRIKGRLGLVQFRYAGFIQVPPVVVDGREASFA